jgi:diguanylate cyclase (GGDEF)-like protein/PAS domain S-box-containing protein
VVVTDADFRIAWWNAAAQAAFGWQADEVIDQPLSDFVPEDAHTELADVAGKILAGEPLAPYETRRVGRDGQHVAVRVHPVGAYSEGRLCAAAVVVHDLSAEAVRRREVTELAGRTDRLASVLAVLPVCLATFDQSGAITHAAGSGFQLLGLEPDTTIGRKLVEVYGDNLDIREAIETCLDGRSVDLVTEFGRRLWDVHYRPHLGPDGDVRGGIVVGQDITAWVHEGTRGRDVSSAPSPGPGGAEELLDFVERDDVTGLLGKRGIERRLSEPVPAGQVRGVAVMNVDGFALVNDAYGSEVGDQALRALGQRLREHVADADLGRWYGDEFVIVLDGPQAHDELEALVERIADHSRQPLTVQDCEVQLGLSFGLVTNELSRHLALRPAAKQALTVAKRAGRDRSVWFEHRMSRPTRRGMVLTNQLRRAIDEGQLVLHYQPILELTTGLVAGLEALVRWQHPTDGLLAPDGFIEVVERTGLAAPLGAWVLHEACQAAVSISAVGLGAQTMAVNLSAEQLNSSGLRLTVQNALQASGCEPSRLTLEVTETAVMGDLESAAATLQSVKDIGVKLALDDFGTGYSSLLYLKHFPVDKLKIDRSFVAGVDLREDDTAIVAATISLAETLNIMCIAEGIETIAQKRVLQELGCGFGQGYLFSRPQPLEALLPWLTQQASRAHPGYLVNDDGQDPLVVAQILSMHRQAASLNTIAARLNNEGHRTTRGTRWTANAVARVIAATQFPQLRKR